MELIKTDKYGTKYYRVKYGVLVEVTKEQKYNLKLQSGYCYGSAKEVINTLQQVIDFINEQENKI
jgi:hypothetical protein